MQLTAELERTLKGLKNIPKRVRHTPFISVTAPSIAFANFTAQALRDELAEAWPGKSIVVAPLRRADELESLIETSHSTRNRLLLAAAATDECVVMPPEADLIVVAALKPVDSDLSAPVPPEVRRSILRLAYDGRAPLMEIPAEGLEPARVLIDVVAALAWIN